MRLNRLIIVMLLMLLSACGSGGKDKVGSLGLTVNKTDNGNGTYTVTASAAYSHPTVSNLVGVEIAFDAPTIGFHATDSTNSSGEAGVLFTVNRLATPYSFVVSATTGSLQDSEAVSIPELGALTVSPTTLTFATTDPVGTIKSSAISDGTAPYTASASNGLVTVSVSGTSLSVTRASSATGTSVVTITDSATATASATVTVTLQ